MERVGWGAFEFVSLHSVMLYLVTQVRDCQTANSSDRPWRQHIEKIRQPVSWQLNLSSFCRGSTGIERSDLPLRQLTRQ